jgi:hypothetical protein
VCCTRIHTFFYEFRESWKRYSEDLSFWRASTYLYV